MKTEPEKDIITLSVHVVTIPCPEEFYMGVNASHEAYIIPISEDSIPKELLKVIKNDVNNKRIDSIAILKG